MKFLSESEYGMIEGTQQGLKSLFRAPLTIQEENSVFEVNAGESLLLWPNRRHVGTEDFPADLRFYWLHFELETEQLEQAGIAQLALEQYCRVQDASYVVSLFRQFLTE